MKESPVAEPTITEKDASANHQPNWWLSIILIGLWLVALVAFYSYLVTREIELAKVVAWLFALMGNSFYGPIIYLSASLLRPLTFLPVSSLAVLAGLFFGFSMGLAYAFLSVLLSSVFAYFAIRFISHPPARVHLTETKRNWTEKLRQYPFEAILLMHLTLIPFDAINYLAGLLRLPFWPFLGATLLGFVPGLLMFTALGAGINLTVLLEEGLSLKVFDPRYAILSLIILTVSLIASRLTRRFFSLTKR